MGAKFEGQYPHTSLDLGTSPFRCNLNISQRFWECSPEIFCNHRGVQHRHISEKGEETMKEKLMNALGTVGIILYYLVSLFICVIPFVMIVHRSSSMSYFLPLCSFSRRRQSFSGYGVLSVPLKACRISGRLYTTSSSWCYSFRFSSVLCSIYSVQKNKIISKTVLKEVPMENEL